MTELSRKEWIHRGIPLRLFRDYLIDLGDLQGLAFDPTRLVRWVSTSSDIRPASRPR